MTILGQPRFRPPRFSKYKTSRLLGIPDAFWLARATNYPIPMCYWSLCHHEWNETIAEQWLHDEATAHGYHKKDSPKHRGIVGSVQKQ